MVNARNDLFLVYTINSHEWTTSSSSISKIDWLPDLLVVINPLPVVLSFELASGILSIGSAEDTTGSK